MELFFVTYSQSGGDPMEESSGPTPPQTRHPSSETFKVCGAHAREIYVLRPYFISADSEQPPPRTPGGGGVLRARSRILTIQWSVISTQGHNLRNSPCNDVPGGNVLFLAVQPARSFFTQLIRPNHFLLVNSAATNRFSIQSN